MKKRVAVACSGWLLIEVLLILTATVGHVSLMGIAAGILAAMVLLSWLGGFYMRNYLEAEIRIPATADKRQKKTGTLAVKNRTRIPVMHLYGELEVHNALTGEETILEWALTVPAEGQTEESFELQSEHCGYIRVRIRRMWIMDWFGILPVPMSCDASGKLSVLPDTFFSQVSLELPFYQTEEEESYAPDKKGYDLSEIYQLRDYVEGDPIRQIHWKLSGKLDSLIVRDPALPVSRSLLVLWDKNTAEASPAEMDAMAEAVASVCQALSQNGVVYTLAWTDGSELHREEISGTEELLQTIPQMYKSGADPERSGADWWLETYGRAEYGKVLYFARTLPGTIEDFTDGQICALLCDGTAADSRIVTITYKADTVMEDLQMVVL